MPTIAVHNTTQNNSAGNKIASSRALINSQLKALKQQQQQANSIAVATTTQYTLYCIIVTGKKKKPKEIQYEWV